MSWLTEPPPPVFEMDWDHHLTYPRKITEDTTVRSDLVNEFKGEEYAKRGDPSCPTCKNAGRKVSWPIELDPKTVNEIDLPLIEELHRRVDYLVEPVANKLSVKQKVLEAGAKQVVDATEHHDRIYDFGLKHKGQLLIPKYIQDEQNEVQL